jgi:hypothetical protein
MFCQVIKLAILCVHNYYTQLPFEKLANKKNVALEEAFSMSYHIFILEAISFLFLGF